MIYFLHRHIVKVLVLGFIISAISIFLLPVPLAYLIPLFALGSLYVLTEISK